MQKQSLLNEKCKICGSDHIRFYCPKDNYSVYQCQECKCGFLLRDNNVPDLHTFYQSYYSPNKAADEGHGYDDYFSLQRSIQKTSQKRIAEIIKYLKPTSRPSLLDIGCGPGFFLKEASLRFETFGTDISQHAVDLAKEKLNLNVIQSDFQKKIYEKEKFDVITLWDVIEHLPDPKTHIKNIAEILKPEGIVALTTGDIESLVSRICGAKWHLMTLPEHLFFFSQKGIKLLLESFGLELIHLSFPVDYYTVDYLIERGTKSLKFGLKYRKHLKLRGFLSRFVVPFSLLDIMFVIARKKI